MNARPRVIIADGELQASQKLAGAAEVMAKHPAALQLRLLQTVVEVAAEKNSTLVLPFPVELLRFLERATPNQPPMPAPTTAPPRRWPSTQRPSRRQAQMGRRTEQPVNRHSPAGYDETTRATLSLKGNLTAAFPRWRPGEHAQTATQRRPAAGLPSEPPRTSRPGRFGTNEETPAARKVQNRAQCEAYSRAAEAVPRPGVSR